MTDERQGADWLRERRNAAAGDAARDVRYHAERMTTRVCSAAALPYGVTCERYVPSVLSRVVRRGVRVWVPRFMCGAAGGARVCARRAAALWVFRVE